ncbi:MAG: hypothetical protein OXN97_24960 [Bryobacterales bacterium]|nr:hypothetical protein [Bryobacterales bacterium]
MSAIPAFALWHSALGFAGDARAALSYGHFRVRGERSPIISAIRV